MPPDPKAGHVKEPSTGSTRYNESEMDDESCRPSDSDIAASASNYTPDGVDVTLIRWMLSLTPAQRLEFLQQRIDDIRTIRELNARG